MIMNSSKGKSVPDQFPAGLRVLVVDDDPTCLKIIDKMLRLCHYEVTTCSRATVALSLLREKRGSFDLVITDVYMPDMDGFKLLEHVGLELDLPVIMMSADVEVKAAMKGLKHGACFYLMKPVGMEELKNIWQHVVRKKKSEYKEPEISGSAEDSEIIRKTSDDLENVSSVNEGNWKHPKRKKDVKEEEGERDENDDSSTLKKQRVVWLPELHQQFLTAVNQLGFDKAVPKKILELMNVPGLTRENVASHLQKFRLLLRRLSEVTQPQGGLAPTFQGGGSNTRFGLNAFEFASLAGSPHFLQPHKPMPMQSGFGGKSYNPNTATAMPAFDSLHFFNQEPQSSSSLAKLRYGQPLLDNQGNFLQARPNSRSEPMQISHMQGNDGISRFSMGSHQLTMAGQIRGVDLGSRLTALQFIHQRHQRRPEQNSDGQLDTFSMVQMLPNGNQCNSLSNTRSGSLYGRTCRRLSQVPSLDFMNSRVSDSLGNNSPLLGSSQEGLSCKALSDINLSNYMLDEINQSRNQDWQLHSMVPGLEASSLSVPEFCSLNSNCNGMASLDRFERASQYDDRWGNGVQQQNNSCARTIADGLSDVVTSLKSNNSLCNELSGQDGLSDLVLQQLQDGADLMEPELDIDAYHVDDIHV